jgi:hypothetical protein
VNPTPSSQDGDRRGDAELFVKVPLQILNDGSLSHAAKLVYGRLKLYAGKNGRCYPSQQTLAREVCLRERQLRNVLLELQVAGWIDWRQTRSTCVYTIFSDRQKTADQTGKNFPVRPEDLRRSRPEGNCQQKRGFENHHQHQQKNIEKSAAVRQRSLQNSEHDPSSHGKTPSKSKIDDDEKNHFAIPAGPHLELNGRLKNGHAFMKADDGKPKPLLPYCSPEDELRDVYRNKAGLDIAPDVLSRIKSLCELRSVTLAEYVDALRPHVPNAWANPAGFLTDFARKIHSKTVGGNPAQVLTHDDMIVKETARCTNCRGVGTKDGEYCSCKLGRELKRIEQPREVPA